MSDNIEEKKRERDQSWHHQQNTVRIPHSVQLFSFFYIQQSSDKEKKHFKVQIYMFFHKYVYQKAKGWLGWSLTMTTTKKYECDAEHNKRFFSLFVKHKQIQISALTQKIKLKLKRQRSL
jgi:hypothetical protein